MNRQKYQKSFKSEPKAIILKAFLMDIAYANFFKYTPYPLFPYFSAATKS